MKVGLEKLVAEVRVDSERRMVPLSALLTGQNYAERLVRSFLTESVNTVNTVVQEFGHDAGNHLRQRLERAYLRARLPCLVVLTCISGMAATSTSWKSERSGDDEEPKQTESRPSKTFQGPTKTSGPRASGKGCAARSQLLFYFCKVLVLI